MKKENVKKIKQLETKIAELTAGWQRTQADFVNFKKQVASDREKLIKAANSDLVYNLLPVLDNFKLAADHLPKDLEGNNWAQGVKHIERQLESILANEGLERIKTVGEQFNPKLHEAIEHIESEKKENEIIGEVFPGYIYNGEVLRAAKVKVSKPKN